MNFLVWRLHRNQVYFAGAALLALMVLLLVTGTVMANDFNSWLHSCHAYGGTAGTCHSESLFRGDGAIIDLVDITLVIPLLFGLFWGAPLLAKEFEEGTHNLAWTQGVTRRKWLGTNMVWAFLAAAVWAGGLTALVSWWRYPENALDSRWNAFDIQGIVPVAYALFAVALGIMLGAILRRVLPALATTLGIFAVVRVLIGVYVRPHFLTPVTKLVSFTGGSGPPVGSWSISTALIGPNGHNYGNIIPSDAIPSPCTLTAPGGSVVAKGINGNCLATHGFHQLLSYQPASRFWAFQGIEAAIFVGAAIALVVFARWWVLRHDA